MKLLIIGGTGLISTPLVARLLTRGDEVTLFNRGHHSTPARTRQITGDRNDYAAFESAMRDVGMFDAVIDMVGYQPEDGHSVVRAFKGRIGHFIFCSTVDVYAKPASRYPIRDDESYGGLNDYGRRKVEIERTLWEAHERGHFPVTILRPAHTYGDSGALIHGFGPWLPRLRAGQPIIVHGDGISLWSQAHAEDVSAAFVNALGNTGTFGYGYTVTNEEAHPWRRLYEIVAAEMGAPAPRFVTIPTATLQCLAPDWSRSIADNFFGHNIFDITAAKDDLQYTTTISFREGARRVLATLEQRPAPSDSTALARYDRILQVWERAGAAMQNEINVIQPSEEHK